MAALAVSFGVLALAWRHPRYDGRPVASWGAPPRAALSDLTASTGWHVALRTIGLVFFGFGAFAAVFGKDLLTNPVFGMFYVWWWVGLPVASLAPRAGLAGGQPGPHDPRRGRPAHRRRWQTPTAGSTTTPSGSATGRPPSACWRSSGSSWSTRTAPSSGPVRLWCAVYVGVMLIGGAVFGSAVLRASRPVRGLLHADVQAVGLGPATTDGRLLVRSPLANLSTVEVRPGLVAMVAVLFGSTAFDSFRDSTPWVKFVQSTDLSTYLLNNLALLAFCVVVGLVFVAGTMATGVEPGTRRTGLPDVFAHSIVPIVAGYIVAHYLTYLVEVGQQTLILASDPLSNGSNLLGTAGWSVSYAISYHPTALATTKVIAVVLGHVVGVVAAHDRALTVLPERHRITGQLPLLRRDGRLHDRRALPALRGLTRRPPWAGRRR